MTYSAAPPTPAPASVWRTPQAIAAAVSGLLLAVGLLTARLPPTQLLSTACLGVAILAGGYFFGRSAFRELRRGFHITTELLMCVGAVAAIVVGHIDDAAILVFLTAVSEAAESYTEGRTRGAIRALMNLAPKRATVFRGGDPVEVAVEELAVGDLVLVRPAQAVPTDGVILKGSSALNEATVTGESIPVDKRPGDMVLAGSLNGDGSLEIRATRGFADNTIARIIRMVQEAQAQKARSQRWIERFGAIYSRSILLLGLLVAVLPPLLTGGDWRGWLTRAAVVFVAGAPCALMISVPVTLISALGAAAQRGILIKGGAVLEDLAGVRVIALDKTGTLTLGRPEVTDVMALAGAFPGADVPEDALASLAARLEHDSQHPLARAIVRYAVDRGLSMPSVSGFSSHTGGGVSAEIDGVKCVAGSARHFAEKQALDLLPIQSIVESMSSQGKSVVVVGRGDRLVGLIGLQDQPRPGAAPAIAALRAAGIYHVIMLTGDHGGAAAAIAAATGISEVRADLQPGEKAEVIRSLMSQYGAVAMVGDGVNDAPALAEASVGIAMGAAGTDVAIETADVALMADDLMKLVEAIRIARRTRAIMRQNLTASTVVIGALISLAITGVLPLPVAVLAHEVTEVLVVASGLRMTRP